MSAKYQYLIRQLPQHSLTTFKAGIREQAIPALLDTAPAALKLSLTETAPPRLTILPLQRSGLALLSVWHEEDPTPPAWRAGEMAFGTVHGYQVAESVPRAYLRDWPDGEATPGICLLTVLRRHPTLDTAAFMNEWHGRHTPKALRIHPLWNYIRNVVTSPLTATTPPADGLVEEQFQRVADAQNPVRMFGGAVRFLPHMLEVYRHVRYFLDLPRCENFWLTEYHLKSR